MLPRCWICCLVALAVGRFDISLLSGRVAVLQPPQTSELSPLEAPKGSQDRVWMNSEGQHIYWSPRLGSWMWVACDSLLGWQYSIEWNVRQFFKQNPWLVAGTSDLAAGNFVLALVDHCFSSVQFGLIDHNLSHQVALEEADAAYLTPLVRWHMDHELGQRHGGRNFFAVSSFDLGRVDFVGASRIMENWTLLSLNGALDWLQAENMYVIPEPVNPPGPCEERGEWRQPLEGLDWRPQDEVLPFPCRHEWHPVRSASNERPLLAFFAGSLNSCSRRQLFSMFGTSLRPTSVEEMVAVQERDGFGHSTVWVINGSVGELVEDQEVAGPGEQLYREILWASQFCFVLNGSSSVNNVRLVETIMHGCIPVVVADDFQPPFHRDLSWWDIAIFVRTREIPLLPQILGSMSVELAEHKRHLLQKAAPHLDVREQHFWNMFMHAAFRGASELLGEGFADRIG